MIHIDHYAYLSKQKAIEPRQKMAFTLLTLLTCVLLNDPWVSVAVILVMSGYTVNRGGVPLAFFVRLLMLPVTFLMIGIITILINLYDDPAGLLMAVPFAGNWLGISPESMAAAVNLFFKALGATSCLYALSLTTPMVALLSALQKLGLPVLMTDLMGLIYRFIFVLLDTSAAIMTAQHSRLGYGTPGTAYKSFGTMLTMLLVRALKRSDDLYTALESRGYQGELTVLEEDYTKSKGLVLSTVLLNVLLAGLWALTR